jgi:hypothetical protein
MTVNLIKPKDEKHESTTMSLGSYVFFLIVIIFSSSSCNKSLYGNGLLR